MKTDLSVEIHKLQLSLMYDSRIYTTVLMTLSAIMLYALMSAYNYVPLSFWLVYMVSVDLYRILTAKMYAVAEQKKTVDEVSARNHLVVGMLLSGIGWGSCAIILYPQIDLHNKFILFGLIIGVATASTTTLSYKKWVALLYVSLMVVPFVATILFSGGDTVIMAFMVVVYYIFLIKNISVFYANSYRLLVLELEAEEREKEVEQQKEKALQANAVKSEFLANISHELRTPMHAILGFSELGQNKPASASVDEVKAYFPKIRNNGFRLLGLINDLLDLSKLEAGKMDIDRKKVDLVEVIEEVVDDLASLLSEHELTVTYSITSGETSAVFDRSRIVQVVSNLLSNAIKFSPEKACIAVSVCDDELSDDSGIVPAIRVDVADQGPGVPEAQLDSIFEKFMQTSAGVVAGGTGLGLAICAEIVDLHAGRIAVSNNEGAVFSFSLPKS